MSASPSATIFAQPSAEPPGRQWKPSSTGVPAPSCAVNAALQAVASELGAHTRTLTVWAQAKAACVADVRVERCKARGVER